MSDRIVMLAKTYKFDFDPTGYFWSEKLDGFCAEWNGRKLLTSSGKEFPVPSWWTDNLPRNQTLYGELWSKRGDLRNISHIVTTEGRDVGWHEIKFMVYDIPEESAGVYTKRYDRLRDVIDDYGNDHLKLVKQLPVQSMKHLKDTLASHVKQGAEGLIIRSPDNRFERKRSSSLLKVIQRLRAEARVVGYEEGKGRNKGRLGALICRMSNGAEFNIGTGLTDEEREHPVKIGSKVTFEYKLLSSEGVPREPSYVSDRTRE